eukprot:Gb_12227 [translate_table: standard]
MEGEQGKLFIGGISWETTEERLKGHFKAFGEVVETMIMKDRTTGRSRGFGFVIFADSSVADRVVQEKHTIDGRMVEAKKAVPRDEQQNISRSNSGFSGTGLPSKTKKVFVGGLAPTVTENDFKEYFEQFGTIVDVVVMYDQATQRPRGFGFITYDSEDAVDKVMQKTFHELKGKAVEVKQAIPKELSSGTSRNPTSVFSMAAGRGANFGCGFGQGCNPSSAGGCGTRMGIISGHVPEGIAGYSPYGAGVCSAGGYPIGGGLGNVTIGGYGGRGFGSNLACGTGAISEFVGGSYIGESSVYGNTVGYVGTNGGFGSSPGGSRNMWSNGGIGCGLTGSSFGYGLSGNDTMSVYGGAGTWGSALCGSNQAIGNSPCCPNGSFGFGSIGSSNSSVGGGHARQSSGHEAEAAPYGSDGAKHGREFGDVKSIYGYGDSTWKSAESMGPFPSDFGLGSAVADGLEKYGAYGVAGRQTQREVAV